MISNILDTLKKTQGCVFFALDKEYRYISFSDEHFKIMEKIWGKSISEGSSILDYIKSEEDRDKAKDNFEKVLAG